jgi:L-ascorbate metabolism protein UlaG (beta-lactamase superfamily)
MKIKWYGHSAFRLTSSTGVSIILDPYESGAFGGALAYGKIEDKADLVLTSHEHNDHNYTKDIKGNFTLINGSGTYKIGGITIQAIPSYHDSSQGTERGTNLIFVIEVDGITIAHLGDLGHGLDKTTLVAMGKIDVLLLPVGGFYTIDAQEATKAMRQLNPPVTIPMHYKTTKCDFPIAPVGDFTVDKKAVRILSGSEIEITRLSIPTEPEVFVLQPAL